jgi:predicted enzyme related to lactoylglutathione lyase
MQALRICIDVDDLERGLAFYTRAFDLEVGRRFDSDWAELLGGSSPIDLLAVGGEASAVPGQPIQRRFERHWTPVHLDFMVQDVERAVARAVQAGAVLERPIQDRAYGRLANLADPFGHGICLLQLTGEGYDALLGQDVKSPS